MKKIILTALLATSLLAEIVYEYEAKYTTDQFLKDPQWLNNGLDKCLNKK